MLQLLFPPRWLVDQFIQSRKGKQTSPSSSKMPDTTIRVEPIYYYRPGGYHPTHIGDKFANGRYEVVHKLGFGAHATVWLARDHTGNKFVALKILVASVSGTTDSEVRILRALAAGDLHHEGRRYVSILLDEFEVEGVNGKHQCIVSDVAGCSVSQSKRLCLSKLFPMDVARAVTAQLLLGLSYIHSCGVVHAGE